MIFMVVPLEQGVHNPQIMTRCPKGVENRYWVRTYSYNDISRLLLSSSRLHATARPHVQTSVFFVNKLWHLKSPMGSHSIGMLKYFWIVKSRIIENGSPTKRLAFWVLWWAAYMTTFLRAFVWVKAEGEVVKSNQKVKAPYLFSPPIELKHLEWCTLEKKDNTISMERSFPSIISHRCTFYIVEQKEKALLYLSCTVVQNCVFCIRKTSITYCVRTILIV